MTAFVYGEQSMCQINIDFESKKESKKNLKTSKLKKRDKREKESNSVES